MICGDAGHDHDENDDGMMPICRVDDAGPEIQSDPYARKVSGLGLEEQRCAAASQRTDVCADARCHLCRDGTRSVRHHPSSGNENENEHVLRRHVDGRVFVFRDHRPRAPGGLCRPCHPSAASHVRRHGDDESVWCRLLASRTW
jgi:hypothetical protein